MDTPAKKFPIPLPALLAGTCGVLILLACGLATALGIGGILLFSRSAKAETPALANSSPQKLEAQALPNQNPQEAVIQDVRGWVEIQDAVGQWRPAENDQAVTAGQHVRTGALSSASLVFGDGSRATILANSELSIDSLDAPNGDHARTIVLTQQAGESDHQVARNSLAGSTYEVHTPAGSGQAKGTKFHVAVISAQAAYFYVDEGIIAVTAMEKTVQVDAGQVTIVYINQPPINPVTSVYGQGLVTQTGSTWIIAGQSFAVNEQTILIGSPQTGDWVMVKGHLLADGTKAADWIIRLYTPPVNQFRLTGTVDSIGDKEWKVNGQSIAITATTVIDSGIKVGDTVRVEGQVLAGGKLQASSIHRVDSDTGLPFDFTGIVQQTGEKTWVISGVTVTVSSTTALDKDLKAGDMVRVKGCIQKDGAWLADSILRVENSPHTFAFTGTLESKAPWRVTGVSFETRDYTEIEDDLKIGDLVLVEGTIDENGIWIATRIERIGDEETGRIILIGTLISMNPWVISGIPINVTGATVIVGEIKVNMLVRVELVLQADGTWLAVKIQPLSVMIWLPGCFEITATVVSFDGSQLQLTNWPLLFLDPNVQITDGAGEGDQGEDEDNHDEKGGGASALVPGSVVHILLCFGEDGTIRIVYIIIIEQPIIEPPISDEPPESGKVTVCHKPGKKGGGHTLTIDRSALGAHLGHGDYEGACR